ncbi:MAG: protein rep [Campylobacterales bacterium]|nr:protein rep [Campylobacterales bacterium]
MNQILLNQILQETKFAEHKLQTKDIIFKFYDTGFTKEFEKIQQCGNFLEFALKENQITKETKNKLAGANFCKNRFCPMCNWRRVRNITGQLKDAFSVIQEKQKVATIFLTLTVKNCHIDDLKATISKMNKSFNEMTRTKAFKNSVLGYLKSIEILGDKTPEGEAHPHFHILLVVKKSYFKSRDYLNKEQWIAMWRKALRVDYDPVVDIRRIKSKNESFSDIDSAIIETVKYSVKHTDLVSRTNDDFYYLYTQTKGMRFLSSGGILKEHLNLIKVDEDLINLKKETEALWIEICRLIYTWQNGNYQLKEIKPPARENDKPIPTVREDIVLLGGLKFSRNSPYTPIPPVWRTSFCFISSSLPPKCQSSPSVRTSFCLGGGCSCKL